MSCKHPHFDPTCHSCHRSSEIARDIVDGIGALVGIAFVILLVSVL